MKKNLWVKIFAVALVLMCALTLAACNKDDVPNSNQDLADLDKELAEKAEKGETIKGLIFKKQKTGDVEGYFVSGIGECTDTVVILPTEYEGLKVIGVAANAFKKSNITEVYLPEGITDIKHHAFAGCTTLKYVKLPDSVTEMGSNTFEGCESLEKVYIGKGITVIPLNAFNGCKSLEAVLLEDTNVTYVGDNAFYGCEGMIKLTLGNSITEIGDNAFENCTTIARITIPDSVTKFGNNIFKGCTALGEAHFSSTMTEVPTGMFYNCTTLQKFEIPSNITVIGEDAFRGCESITKLKLESNIVEVKNSAFMRCTALEELYISKSVKKWGNFVTYFCKNLAKIQYEGTKKEYEEIQCLSEPEKGGEIYIVSPNKSLSMYLSVAAKFVECSDGTFDIEAILILNPNKYTIENLNSDIVSSVFIALPAVVVGFGSAIFAKQVCLASLSRATAVIKEEMKAMGERPKAEPKPHFTETVYYRAITVAVRASVTALALVFIVLGIMNGGMADVINKAVKICTECIGLG